MSPRGNESDKCGGSNLLVKPNDSCLCTDSSKTSFGSGVTCCALAITESYEDARSSLGTP